MQNKVFVIGYYGHGNVGDDAMRLGLLDILKYRGCENVRCYSKGRSIFRNIWWADEVILGGGTHLRTWGKGWFKQSARVLALGAFVRLVGNKFHMLNVGIDGDYLEMMASWISNNLTIRDEDSFDSSAVIEYKPREKKKILGISLTPIYQVFFNEPDKDRKLVENLMVKVSEWLKENPEYQVKFFNFNKMDEPLNLYAMSLVGKAEFRYYQSDVLLNLEEVSECSYFIPMRYHTCQFAYKTETPMMVIDAYPSCRKFAEFVGVPLLEKEIILGGNFKLDFRKSSFPIEIAKTLAFKGVQL